MKNPFTVTFVCEKKKATDSYGYLRCRISHGSKLFLKLSLGHQINPEKFKEGRCSVGSSHGAKKISAFVINAEIRDFKDKVEDAIYTLAGTTITPAALKQAILKPASTISNDITVKEAFRLFKQSCRNKWSISTEKRMKAAVQQFCRYKDGLKVAEITEEVLSSMVEMMFDLNCQNSHINKTFQKIRAFLKWCKEQKIYHGKIDFDPRLSVISDSNRQIIYLTWQELMSLYSYKFSANYLSQVRDVFCFCCFTSLRYSDVSQLRKCDIYDDALHVVTRKTHDCLVIELNDYSRAILARYSGLEFKDGLALPIISNQRFNDYLKEACKLAGIDAPMKRSHMVRKERIDEFAPKYEFISSHAARRTFVVHALRLGIPVEVIIKWTGHSDYKAMRPYIDIVDDLKKSNMSKFNF